MFAETVPVNVLLEIPDALNPRFALESIRLIEIDGYYLISIEQYKRDDTFNKIDICFIRLKDAWHYLEICGVEKGDYLDEEEAIDHESE